MRIRSLTSTETWKSPPAQRQQIVNLSNFLTLGTLLQCLDDLTSWIFKLLKFFNPTKLRKCPKPHCLKVLRIIECHLDSLILHHLVNPSDNNWKYKQVKSKSGSSIFGPNMTKSGALTYQFFFEKCKNMFFTRIEAFWAFFKKKFFEKFLVEKFSKSGLWPPCNRRNLKRVLENRF